MTLDLTRPEHRERVAWAATVWARDPNEAKHRLADPWLPHPEFDLDRTSLAVFDSPFDSASIVRALLEGCGVDTDHATDGAQVAECIVHSCVVVWISAPGDWVEVHVGIEKLPALVLALLASDAEGALAALREAGR